MAYTPEEKLDMFEQAILKKAETEKQAILQESEDIKKAELEQEENRLLEELYHHIQSEVSQIKTAGVKEIAHANTKLKKELYQQREQYIKQVLSLARAELVSFVKTQAYGDYLIKKAALLAKDHKMDGSVIKLRSQDLSYQNKIQEAYGPCEITADDETIKIGGIILENRASGILVDYSLDTALEEQKNWLYNNSGLILN